MNNVSLLPSLEFEAGLQCSCTDTDVTSLSGVVTGVVTGIVIGLNTSQ